MPLYLKPYRALVDRSLSGTPKGTLFGKYGGLKNFLYYFGGSSLYIIIMVQYTPKPYFIMISLKGAYITWSLWAGSSTSAWGHQLQCGDSGLRDPGPLGPGERI